MKVAIIDKKQCVACGCCVNICPKNAIAMFKGKYAVVDEELCVGCGKCSEICPASVINMEVVKND